MAACSDPRPVASAAAGGGGTGGSKACTLCHGDATRLATGTNPKLPAAPPNGTKGETSPSTKAVGAHLLHLQDGSLRPAIECAECHVVPTITAHSNGAVELTFGPLAKNGGAVPLWNGSSCSASYCHGGFPGGDATNAPTWTAPRTSSCGTCHGLPPAAPHPTLSSGASCGGCHSGYTATTVDLASHMNGKVDVAGLGCSSCHGDATRTGADPYIAAMPPLGTKGETLNTQPAVGAHLAHLTAGAFARAFACTDCHNPPSSTSHATGAVEFSWSVLAGGSAVTYDPTSHTCSSTYCHGNFAGGNSLNKPSWISGNTGAACGSCHGAPPPPPHSQSTSCDSCHPGYTATSVNIATHVNGIVDVVALACTTCHGTAGVNAAPPVDSTGRSATTFVSVGAHQAHVASTLRPAIACTECHGAASATYTTAHSDGTVQTSFGTLANQGTTTVWTAGTATCASNYCHGGSTALSGGTGTTPVWTTVNGSFRACTSCHGNPPALSAQTHHPRNLTCATCHGTGYSATTVVAATHVNGTVNLTRTGCTLCHGDLTQTGVAPTSGASAPGFNAASADTTGATAATAPAVGAHSVHLTGTRWRSAAIACSECHVTPAAGDVTHATGTGTGGARATVAFGTLARTGGITTAGYAGSTTAANGTAAGTCSNTYCHGNFTGSGATSVLSWTGGAAAAACGTCHGAPPPAPHAQNTACGDCHTGYTATTVNAATHVNGVVELTAMTCTSCHGDPLRTGTDPNIAAMPPRGTAGETLTTQPAVGAHLAHLTAGTLARAFACIDCHNPPVSTTHATGTTTFSWSVLAGGSAVTYNFTNQTCSSTYCHGNFSGGIVTNAPSWIAGSAGAACGSCHGAPPPAPHPQNTACGTCHVGYTQTSVNLANHVNGLVDVVGQTCTTCHGTTGRASVALADANQAAAPPVVASATGVAGVHLAHVNQGSAPALSSPLACNNCHIVPASSPHSNGVVGVTYANLAVAQGAVPPAYNLTAHSCASTYCHGNFPGGNQSATSILWTATGKLGCTACHGGPPPTATTHHPANTNCVACHTGYTSATVTAATHVDGTVQKPANGCTACHGVLAGQAGAAVANTSATSAPGFTAAAVDASGSALTTSRGVGAHFRHLTPTLRSAGLACTECHVLPAAGDTTHATGPNATLAWGALATRNGSVPTAVQGATPSCSANWCHGGNTAFISGATASTLTWNTGATVNCTSCHGSPPTGLGHPNNTNCATCHGTGYTWLTATTGSISLAALTTHIDGIITLVVAESCTSCHGTPGRASVAGADANQAAAPPNDVLGASAGVLVGTHLAHVNPASAGAVFKAIACTECHPNNTANNHGNGTVNVTFAAATGANLGGFTATFVQGNGTSTATTCATYCHGTSLGAAYAGSVAIWAWNGAAAACGSCHGLPPTSGGHAGVAASASACNTCHGGTVNLDGTINVAGGLHINGQLDGGGEPATGGTSCGGCHAAYFNAMTAAPSGKVSRHALGSDVPQDSASSWTGTDLNSSVALANRTCVTMCHSDHPHTVSSPAAAGHANNVFLDATTQATRAAAATTLVGTGGAGTQNRAKTDFDSALNAGLCASCHQRPIVASGITVGAANFGTSAHDYASNTVGANTYTWIYALHDASTFGRNCTKCHASRVEGNTPTVASGAVLTAVHYSDTDPNLLAGTTNPAGNAANFICYNCHGSTAAPAVGAQGNRSGKNIQAQVAKSGSSHPANLDAVHNSATEFANAVFGNTLGVTGRHASCLDCHDPHEARTGTHAVTTNFAGPPLQGAWGARFVGPLTAWAAPTIANFTKTTITAGTELEATLCFKCHSAFYGTLPTSPSSSPAFTETDQAREFNPANVSFHPVLAAAGATIGAVNMANLVTTNFAWRTSGARNLMTCTDCHESETVTDPSGPHGSAARFILKGPNTAWLSTTTNNGTMNGAFCANCHSSTYANSRFPAHTRGDHFIACMNCHGAIPHGGPRAGMLNPGAGTTLTAVPTWDGVAPYWQGGASNRLFLKSYPANNTTNWVNGNCGCNGANGNGH